MGLWLKERRGRGALPPPKFPLPWTAKLMSDILEMDVEAAGKILSDRSDFTVIGFIGAQGAGKSSLASTLCQASAGRDRPFGITSARAAGNSQHEARGIPSHIADIATLGDWVAGD